jgi:hypothetical protein
MMFRPMRPKPLIPTLIAINPPVNYFPPKLFVSLSASEQNQLGNVHETPPKIALARTRS